MNTTPVLMAYLDVQAELHKIVEYHTAQEPKFNNLVRKIGILCQTIQQEHDTTPEMIWTKYGFAENFLAYPNGDNTPNGLVWLHYFDKTLLNPEYNFKKAYSHLLWIVLQGNLIRDLLTEQLPTKAIILMWILAESVHRQCHQHCLNANFELPSIRECYCSVAYPHKESPTPL